jgi:hypothetical protein
MNILIPLASIAVPYLPWLVVICLRLPRYARALQSVNYSTGRYFDWWLKNPSELRFLLSAIIVLPAVIVVTNYLIDRWQQDTFYIVLLIVNFVFAIVLFSLMPRYQPTQQLKDTGRTRRLIFVAGIISVFLPLAMIATYFTNLNSPTWDVTFWSTNAFRYTVNVICAALFYAVPLAILIANLINIPVDVMLGNGK